jgi:hypothetical protein
MIRSSHCPVDRQDDRMTILFGGGQTQDFEAIFRIFRSSSNRQDDRWILHILSLCSAITLSADHSTCTTAPTSVPEYPHARTRRIRDSGLAPHSFVSSRRLRLYGDHLWYYGRNKGNLFLFIARLNGRGSRVKHRGRVTTCDLVILSTR